MSYFIQITITVGDKTDVYKYKRKSTPLEAATDVTDFVCTRYNDQPAKYATSVGAHMTKNRVTAAVDRICLRKRLSGPCQYRVELVPVGAVTATAGAATPYLTSDAAGGFKIDRKY